MTRRRLLMRMSKDCAILDDGSGHRQITHIVSDFASYNRLNLALDTDYDYRSFCQLAFPSA